MQTTGGATPLMYACQQCRENEVLSIITKQPYSVQDRDRTLKTPLHYCAENSTTNCAETILRVAPELVNAQDENGYSTLHMAVIAGNKPLIKLLITKGADINIHDNEGHSAVHWAIVSSEKEALEMIIRAGANPSTPDIHGGYPLHYAAQMCGSYSDYIRGSGDAVKVVQTLLLFGVDVNVKDKDGRQPILWAASAGSADAVVHLVHGGASVDAADKDGLTALHCAASRGHTNTLETLITLCGADVDVIDGNGCSALFYSVTLGHADSTEVLLQLGAEPNRQDRKGRTPAHCGAAKGQLETLRILQKHGGNLWMRNVKGDLPLHEAVASGRKDLVLWLLSQNPEAINIGNNDGRVPLHIAAMYNNTEMVKILLDARSLVNPVMRTTKGVLMTPLNVALCKGHRSCGKFLQLHGGVPFSKVSRTDTHFNVYAVRISPSEDVVDNTGEGEAVDKTPSSSKLSKSSDVQIVAPEITDKKKVYRRRKKRRGHSKETKSPDRDSDTDSSSSELKPRTREYRKSGSGNDKDNEGNEDEEEEEEEEEDNGKLKVKKTSLTSKSSRKEATDNKKKPVSPNNVKKEVKEKNKKIRKRSAEFEDTQQNKSNNEPKNVSNLSPEDFPPLMQNINQLDTEMLETEIDVSKPVSENENIEPEPSLGVVNTELNTSNNTHRTEEIEDVEKSNDNPNELDSGVGLSLDVSKVSNKSSEIKNKTSDQTDKINSDGEKILKTEDSLHQKNDAGSKEERKSSGEKSDRAGESRHVKNSKGSSVHKKTSSKSSFGKKNSNGAVAAQKSENASKNGSNKSLVVEENFVKYSAAKVSNIKSSDGDASDEKNKTDVDEARNDDEQTVQAEEQRVVKESNTVQEKEEEKNAVTAIEVLQKSAANPVEVITETSTEITDSIANQEVDKNAMTTSDTQNAVETDPRNEEVQVEAQDVDPEEVEKSIATNPEETTLTNEEVQAQESTKVPDVISPTKEEPKAIEEPETEPGAIEEPEPEPEPEPVAESESPTKQLELEPNVQESKEDEQTETLQETVKSDIQSDGTSVSETKYAEPEVQHIPVTPTNESLLNETQDTIVTEETVMENTPGFVINEDFITKVSEIIEEKPEHQSPQQEDLDHSNFGGSAENDEKLAEVVEEDMTKVGAAVSETSEAVQEANSFVDELQVQNFDKIGIETSPEFSSLDKDQAAQENGLAEDYINDKESKYEDQTSSIPNQNHPNTEENYENSSELNLPESIDLDNYRMKSEIADDGKSNQEEYENKREESPAASNSDSEGSSINYDKKSNGWIASERRPYRPPRVSRLCRKNRDFNGDTRQISVTQLVQSTIRKYHMERGIFHLLLELKRLQIRAGRANEQVLVKRLVDEYERSRVFLGMSHFSGVYKFREFENFLYDQLKVLNQRHHLLIPEVKSSDGIDALSGILKKSRIRILSESPQSDALCTCITQRCHHTTNAYTNVPCSEYVANIRRHKTHKPKRECFLPRIDQSQNLRPEKSKLDFHPATLELVQGNTKQVITLPQSYSDKSKRYYVTFTIKSASSYKEEDFFDDDTKDFFKHRHAKSV